LFVGQTDILCRSSYTGCFLTVARTTSTNAYLPIIVFQLYKTHYRFAIQTVVCNQNREFLGIIANETGERKRDPVEAAGYRAVRSLMAMQKKIS